jgi:hypothetical protein
VPNAIDIALAYRRLDAIIREQDGQVTPEQAEKLLDDKDSVDNKVDALYDLSKKAQAKSKQLKERAAEILATAHYWERVEKSHRWLLMEVIKAAGLKSAGSTPPINLVKNPRPTFTWDKIGHPIPEEIAKVKVEIDSQKCYEAWKEGFVADGVKVHQNFHIRPRHRKVGAGGTEDE